MTTPDPSREAFEKHYLPEASPAERSRIFRIWPDGRYFNGYTQARYEGWHAAMAHKGVDCWQPIETAPKDGRYLLLWEQYSEAPFVGYWAKDSWSVSHEHVDAEGGWNGAIVVDKLQCPITHWMSLPAAPKQEGST